MPLPPNSSISLQGHSRPGEGVTTIPKIAMIVRLTAETLDALQSLSGADKMDFEFGDKPGIYVRDQFFPMRYDKEKENQELFIRTTMPTRPNAPLRLSANVVGKFAVEKVLSDKLSQRMHNATAAALKQKAERKVPMVDNPPPAISAPVAQKPAPKRKAPQKGTPKSSTPTIVKSYATTSPNPAASSNGSPSVALPKELATQYRQRLIHYLALGSATVQDIFKEFGGSEIDHNTRAGIMDLIHDAAEREEVPRKAASTSQPATYRLKPQTWLEVRPYQYSGYTDNVRTRVARTARTWFGSLKIPEDDPAWDHVKFRDSGHGGTSASANAAQRAVNGTTSVAAKKAKKTTKAANAEVKAKSEAVAPASRSSQLPASLPPKPSVTSMRASTPVHAAKGKEREVDTEREEGEISASQTPPQMSSVPPERRLPNQRPSGASTPTMMPPPPVPVSSQLSSSVKRTGPVDARGSRRPPPEPSERARAAPPLPPPPSSADRKPVVQIKKEVVAQPKKERPSSSLGENGAVSVNGSSQSAKERERELARRERERDRESDRESIRMSRKERERDRESDRESIRMSRKERERESDRESIRSREKEKVRALKERELARERAQERPREKLKEKDAGSSSRPVAKTGTSTGATAAKRRASESSDEESSDWGYERRRPAKVKHRESAPTKSSSSSLKVARRESSPALVKQKVKRDASPLPPVKVKTVPVERRAVTSSSSKVSSTVIKKESKLEGRSSAAKAHKRRRSSIDFTSSSEEEEERKPKALTSTTKSSALALSSKTSSSTVSSATPTNHSHNRTSSITRPPKARPALSKRDQLRSRYSSLYNEYILVFQKLVTHKHKVEAMLRHGSESPSGESDVDMNDLMPLDEVQELKARHQKLHDELEEIKKSYVMA